MRGILRLPCPQCRGLTPQITPHSGECQAHGYFLLCVCPVQGCHQDAARQANDTNWVCVVGHRVEGLLCPTCWQIGIEQAEPVNGHRWWRCTTDPAHTFTARKLCRQCSAGYLVNHGPGHPRTCEACGRTGR